MRANRLAQKAIRIWNRLVRTLPFMGEVLDRRAREADRRHIQSVFKGAGNIQIVQIGSNDGQTNDPLFDLLEKNLSWRALFVEPVPFLFKRLCENYGPDPRFSYENVAISETPEKLLFHYVAESAKDQLADLPSWYDQLGSFREDHIIAHLGPRIRPYIIAEEVTAIPLQLVLERNHIEKINLLHIDTEGADWMILRQLDLARFKPDAILIEHKHLSPTEKIEMKRFLANYRIKDLGADYFCRRIAPAT